MYKNLYEIDEILNEAVMTGVPTIIVEGIDDIEIYNEIARSVPFDVEVYAVEYIDGFGEGCEQVIKALKELNEIPNTKNNLMNHVLGIIDKDVRDYRGEIPDVKPILILNYYSIESHFISKNIINSTLSLCSKASQELITDQLCTDIMNDVENKLLDLYYISLESLKHSLEKEYETSFRYSFTSGRIQDQKIKAVIASKKEELDKFACDQGLEPSLETLKSITKGKWLIDVFSYELINIIKSLQGLCETHKILTCKSCIIKAYDKCLYRIKDGINNNTIKSLAITNTDGTDFKYIIDRITNIKKCA